MKSFVQKNITVDSDRREFVMTQNMPKDVVGTVTFDLIGLLPTNHIIILLWYTRENEETFDVNIKIAQTTHCQKVGSTKEMANFGDYPRYGLSRIILGS